MIEKEYNFYLHDYETLSENLDEMLVMACDLIIDGKEKTEIDDRGIVKTRFYTETIIVRYDQTVFGITDLKRAIRKKLPSVGGVDCKVVPVGRGLHISYDVIVKDNFFNELITAISIVKEEKDESGDIFPKKTEFYLWFAGKKDYDEKVYRISYKNWFVAKMYVYSNKPWYK